MSARRAAIATIAATLVLVVAAASCGPGKAPQPPAPEPEQVLQVNATGEPVDLAQILVPGRVTVVDFWATWCAGCAIVDEKLHAAIAGERAVVVRKIDIGDGDTPVARQHKVGALPHVRIYDRTGNLRYVLAGNDAMTAGEAALTLAAEP